MIEKTFWTLHSLLPTSPGPQRNHNPSLKSSFIDFCDLSASPQARLVVIPCLCSQQRTCGDGAKPSAVGHGLPPRPAKKVFLISLRARTQRGPGRDGGGGPGGYAWATGTLHCTSTLLPAWRQHVQQYVKAPFRTSLQPKPSSGCTYSALCCSAHTSSCHPTTPTHP